MKPPPIFHNYKNRKDHTLFKSNRPKEIVRKSSDMPKSRNKRDKPKRKGSVGKKIGLLGLILLGTGAMTAFVGLGRYGTLEPCKMFALEAERAAMRHGLKNAASVRRTAQTWALAMTKKQCLSSWYKAFTK